jgi:hypothetical protein
VDCRLFVALRLLALVLTTLAATGCGGSGDAQQTPTPSETTSTEAQPKRPPTTVDELLASLPPFDVPVSPEVDAYRRAAIGAFYDRCVSGKHGADKASFVRANVALVERMPVFPRSSLEHEDSTGNREHTGCPEGLGPPTSYSTTRSYRLPAGTSGPDVVRYYERRLGGWKRSVVSGQCEQFFRRGEAQFRVVACGGSLSLTAQALEAVKIPPPPALPPRPTGEQYPMTTRWTSADDLPAYEVEPGTTCERDIASGHDGPVPTIIPPTPGLKASLERKPLQLGQASFKEAVVVEWSFERIFGDCPPTKLSLSIANPTPGMPPLTLPFEVHARSGVSRLPVLDSFRAVKLLRARTESVDGTTSGTVEVLIRR